MANRPASRVPVVNEPYKYVMYTNTGTRNKIRKYQPHSSPKTIVAYRCEPSVIGVCSMFTIFLNQFMLKLIMPPETM